MYLLSDAACPKSLPVPDVPPSLLYLLVDGCNAELETVKKRLCMGKDGSPLLGNNICNFFFVLTLLCHLFHDLDFICLNYETDYSSSALPLYVWLWSTFSQILLEIY